MLEKKAIKKHRLIWLIILVVCIIIPILTAILRPDIYIISSTFTKNRYDSTMDTSTCTIEVLASDNQSSGSIIIAFYDEHDVLLEKKTGTFSPSENALSETFYNVDGKVATYEIISHSLTQDYFISILVIFINLAVWALIFFLISLTYSCKVYQYLDNEIIVYAGARNHYIKVNGEKYDEYVSSFAITPVKLTCTLNDNTFVETTISVTNKIALKINGKLYQPTK